MPEIWKIIIFNFPVDCDIHNNSKIDDCNLVAKISKTKN